MDVLNSLFDYPWYWLIAGVVLMGMELIASGVFLIWIGIGAFITGLAAKLFPGMPLSVQVIVLIIAMVGSVLLGVRFQSRRKQEGMPTLNTGASQYVGRTVVATQTFHAGRGRIKVDDTTYPAQCRAEVVEGQVVVVTAVKDSIFEVDAPVKNS